MVSVDSAGSMRVAINGWFLNQPFTGSGQYTMHLTRRLKTVDAHISQPARSGNLAKLRWEQLDWPRLAARSRADVWHSPYFALPLRRTRPSVVTIHDLIPMVLPEYRGSALVQAYTALQALACRSADAILVDSECSKRDVMRLLRIPEQRIRVIYLGVEDRFKPDPSGEPPLDRPYVLYVGGLDVRKNVPMLIEAFGLIASRFPELVLAITGEPRSAGRMFPDVREPAAKLGERVRFLGWVSEDQKLRLYQHARLFAYPSLYEGFGLNPLEALACGCPVVSSDASSLPEVVGQGGLLADARDARAFSEAMVRALEDSEALRQRGPGQAALFSWERCAAETELAYQAALQ